MEGEPHHFPQMLVRAERELVQHCDCDEYITNEDEGLEIPHTYESN